MSEIDTSEGALVEIEKPVEDVKFPPFPDPSDKDFDEDLSEEEKAFYKNRFPDINTIVNVRLHCTACDRHLGCSAKNENRMRPHPMLRTLICHTCHSFYNSGEFDKGEDGSELYCRWCGQGGQVYCCSNCIHVFCAKCIKRNLGIAKIKEIENTDDWKCFKCNPKCLWEMRAICWALLRFCDIRNKILYHTEDPELKEKYQRAITTDSSECCKNKGKRKEKTDSAKKKEREADLRRSITRLPPTIQVKKFASINANELPKVEAPKKAQKRPASPKVKMAGYIQKPIAIAPCTITNPPPLKKIRMSSAPLLNPVRMTMDRKIANTYTRMSRPRQAYPIPSNAFNGFQNPYSVNIPSLMGDNINLSLETLTQGLDMAAVAAFNNSAPSVSTDSDVVCTPDFPLEPLCEVNEDNDDDVECITPGPVATPKVSKPTVPRTLPDLSNDNIIQMTENDVTVNTLTGGLKFRVDPQTLSSKKMYRLPDGRIFAINPNPSMPGGYSATIVSVSDAGGKPTSKGGETFAAKLSAVVPQPKQRNNVPRKQKTKQTKAQKQKETEKRECDLKVPVEWYRYNLIDAVDALDYSLSRLNKLKKEASTGYLRSRSIEEMKYLHRTLEQLLTTSSKRFLEIRDNFNKEFKEYMTKKTQSNTGDVTEDDDDVEFLPNSGNDDPIFIDENSMDSVNVTQEVDLTGLGSEHNNSAENKNTSDPHLSTEDSIVGDKDLNNTSDSLDSVREVRGFSTVSKDVNDADKTIEQDSESNKDNLDEKSNCKTDSRSETPNGNTENEKPDGNAVDDLTEKKDILEKSDNEDLKDEVNDKEESDVSDKPDLKLEDKNNSEIKTDDHTSDIEGNFKSKDEQKTEQVDSMVEKDGMDVDHNQSVDKSLTDSKQVEDVDMSDETIETLLKGNDTIGDTNSNGLDDLEGLKDKL